MDSAVSVARPAGNDLPAYRLRIPEAPEEELERARRLLATVDQLIGSEVAASTPDADSIEHRLSAAEHEATTALRRAHAEHDEVGGARLLGALIQLHQARVDLRDAALMRRGAAMVTVQDALRRLRAAPTVAQLVERLPREIGRLGFRRSLVSRIDTGFWIARKAFVEHDPELGALIVQAGSDEPARLTAQLLELELVRRRRPMMVRDPQTNPRVHRRLAEVTGTRSYVAAPVIADDKVIGFLHGDEYLGSRSVDEFSRDLLGMFAEGVGHAVERTVYFERLLSLRDKLTGITRGVADLVDEFVCSQVELASPGGAGIAPLGGAHLRQVFAETPESPLTGRELEVLRHLAAGETNAHIAGRLVVTEGTVKTHVKHILRKLGAANRAEAVARYHTRLHS